MAKCVARSNVLKPKVSCPVYSSSINIIDSYALGCSVALGGSSHILSRNVLGNYSIYHFCIASLLTFSSLHLCSFCLFVAHLITFVSLFHMVLLLLCIEKSWSIKTHSIFWLIPSHSHLFHI